MSQLQESSNPINPQVGSLVTVIDGEPVLAHAELHGDSYSCYRICACAGVGAALYGVGALAALAYVACGGSCRKEEVQRTHMYLTRSAIVFDRYVYVCGCCCYKQERKMVPLEKVQDVALAASCCADCCGFVPPGTKYYKLEIQTAGASGPKATGAEIQAIALADPEGFRNAVLAARRILNGRGTDTDTQLLNYSGPVFGEGKTASDSAAVLGASAGAAMVGSSVAAGDERVVALLGRIGDLLEQVVENGSTGK